MSPEEASQASGHASTPADGSAAILNAEGRVVGERGMVPNRHARRANARATRPPRNPHPGQRLPIPAPLTDPDWQQQAAEAKLPQMMARQTGEGRGEAPSPLDSPSPEIDAQRRALARARKDAAA